MQAVDPTKLSQSQYFRVKAKWDALQKRVRKLERDFEERVYAGREKMYQKKMQALQVEANKLNDTANKLGL